MVSGCCYVCCWVAKCGGSLLRPDSVCRAKLLSIFARPCVGLMVALLLMGGLFISRWCSQPALHRGFVVVAALLSAVILILLAVIPSVLAMIGLTAEVSSVDCISLALTSPSTPLLRERGTAVLPLPWEGVRGDHCSTAPTALPAHCTHRYAQNAIPCCGP